MIRSINPYVDNGYPTTDGRPMAETDWHRDLMLRLIETLKHHYAADPEIYVSGNLLVFYKPNDKRRHVSPDVFVVRGIRAVSRPNYLIWEEGKAPEVVIELTSKTTRREDLDKKFKLYRDVLEVKEYFLYDPLGDYLDPVLQGYRLVDREFRPIRMKDGRMPSRLLGLHFEPAGVDLRIWNPVTGEWLPTDDERAYQERTRANEERTRANEERARRLAAEEEVARLRDLLSKQSHASNGKNGANGK
jgi:Uma2 family endonuclease